MHCMMAATQSRKSAGKDWEGFVDGLGLYERMLGGVCRAILPYASSMKICVSVIA